MMNIKRFVLNNIYTCCKLIVGFASKYDHRSFAAMTLNSCVVSAKAVLRNDMKNKLKLLETDDKFKQSEWIFNKLRSLAVYKDSQRISVYLSTDGEVDTRPIIEDILRTNRKCFVPRYAGSDMKMLRLHSIEDYESLPMTKWNIKQPETSEGRENALETGGLDLVIVPGVAFTRHGSRLGHGRGYYDTFLNSLGREPSETTTATTNTSAATATVALAFRQQILDEIPCESHDVTMDKVIYYGCE